VSQTMSKFTPRQERFVKEYLVDLNATQAAIRAGYSEKTARQTASENLSKPYIAEAIAEGFKKLQRKTGRSAEDVVNDLREVTKRCMQHAPVLDKKGQQVYVETPDGEKAAAYTFNAKDALKGLELEGKYRGIFKEQFDLNIKRDIKELSDDELDAIIERLEAR